MTGEGAAGQVRWLCFGPVASPCQLYRGWQPHHRQQHGRKQYPALSARAEELVVRWYSGRCREASALLYSLIETVRANKLEPYASFRYIFDKMPMATKLENYETLLPWNLALEQLAVPNLVKCG